MPTVLLVAPRAVTVQRSHCSKHSSQWGQHAGKNWTGRQNALEQKKTCNRHESNPTSSPGLQQAGAPEFVRRADDTTRRASRNATWFPHHPDNYFYSWNHPWGKTKEEHWKLTTSHMGRANWLDGLQLKNNKTQNPEHTMLQTTFQQHLWLPILQELNHWQNSNPFFTPSERAC